MSVSITVSRDISAILTSLKIGFTSTDGRIGWPAYEYDEWKFALIASLKFSPKIDDYEKDDSLWKTVNDCAKVNRFSQTFFLQQLRNNVNALRQRAPQTYTVTAQLNLPRHVDIPRSISSMLGSVIVARALNVSERKIIEKQPYYNPERLRLENDFLFLRHRFKARSTRNAIDYGYRNLQCCVGILNLSAGRLGLSRRFGMPNVPLGRILLASSTVLVDHRKRTVGDWIVDSHYPPAFKNMFTARSTSLRKLTIYTRRWVRQIKSTDFADRLTGAVVLFQEGLSANHVDVALIKFWTCIELLCKRLDQRESQERIIERASSIFTNREMTNLRLNFIAESRHAAVHQGEYGDHALLCAQWASIYAGELIGFCAFNIHGLKKHSEILDYLSAPRSRERLTEVIRIHRLRLKVLQKRHSKGLVV